MRAVPATPVPLQCRYSATTTKDELPPILPEAARLHPAIDYDRTERILAKDAVVYLQDPAFEDH